MIWPNRESVMRSYAQNREDVVLARMLNEVRDGNYVEVGAFHPISKSISYHFYERGWNGVLIEPQVVLCSLLQRFRPRDTTVNVAAAARQESRRFYEVPQASRSTLRKEIAGSYGDWKSTIVPTAPLNDILESTMTDGSDIHFMSIDVEGMEAEVLQGLDLQRFRPWILVVEAIHPVTQEPSEQGWLQRVLDNGYEHALFDGVSSFFVARERSQLVAKCFPASSVDDFVVDYPLGATLSTLDQTGNFDEWSVRLLRLAERLRELDHEGIDALSLIPEEDALGLEELGMIMLTAASRIRHERGGSGAGDIRSDQGVDLRGRP